MTHCLKHRKEFGASENSFDNAWDEANQRACIRIHGKERFMPNKGGH
jgi:flavin-binding protein dodecin